MPRPKAFDPDAALQKAMQVFWERGYEATSVDDLVQCMGINRFSLYSTFGGKHQLFVAALERYHDTIVADLVGELEHRRMDSPPSDSSSHAWSIFLHRPKGGAVA